LKKLQLDIRMDGRLVNITTLPNTISEDPDRHPLPTVAIVLATYLPESFGGAEQQSRKLALALEKLGVRVTILAPRLIATTPAYAREGLITCSRFRLRRAPNLGGRYLGSSLLWALKLSWWMLRHRREFQVVHVIHGRLHALPAVATARFLGKPSVIKIGRGGIEHFDLDVVRRKRWIGAWYAKMVTRHAAAYVANSQEIVQDLERWGIIESLIHRIPNGVDIPSDLRRVPGKTIRYVYLGRLDREKAIGVMIRGFSRLKIRARASLSLVGDGECRAELETLVDELGLRGCVTFTGALPDVQDALRKSDVFVSTSLSEGMSNALLEAMSFGLMPLVSRVSGVSDIVDDEQSGLLFAPGDLDAFTRRLEHSLTLTPEQRQSMGDRARSTIAERFGIDQVAQRHVALYRRLISEFEPS
jgi:glycosyltransferase involved in cell wall biosynthesis